MSKSFTHLIEELKYKTKPASDREHYYSMGHDLDKDDEFWVLDSKNKLHIESQNNNPDSNFFRTHSNWELYDPKTAKLSGNIDNAKKKISIRVEQVLSGKQHQKDYALNKVIREFRKKYGKSYDIFIYDFDEKKSLKLDESNNNDNNIYQTSPPHSKKITNITWFSIGHKHPEETELWTLNSPAKYEFESDPDIVHDGHESWDKWKNWIAYGRVDHGKKSISFHCSDYDSDPLADKKLAYTIKNVRKYMKKKFPTYKLYLFNYNGHETYLLESKFEKYVPDNKTGFESRVDYLSIGHDFPYGELWIATGVNSIIVRRPKNRSEDHHTELFQDIRDKHIDKEYYDNLPADHREMMILPDIYIFVMAYGRIDNKRKLISLATQSEKYVREKHLLKIADKLAKMYPDYRIIYQDYSGRKQIYIAEEFFQMIKMWGEDHYTVFKNPTWSEIKEAGRETNIPPSKGTICVTVIVDPTDTYVCSRDVLHQQVINKYKEYIGEPFIKLIAEISISKKKIMDLYPSEIQIMKSSHKKYLKRSKFLRDYCLDFEKQISKLIEEG